MFNHILSIINSGGFVAVIIIICGALSKLDKIVEAHLDAKKSTLKTNKAQARNAHELSLARAADRIIPRIAKVAEASPQDRLNAGVNELVIYANEHGIPVNAKMAQNFMIQAATKFKRNGGDAVKAVKDTAKDDLHV